MISLYCQRIVKQRFRTFNNLTPQRLLALEVAFLGVERANLPDMSEAELVELEERLKEELAHIAAFERIQDKTTSEFGTNFLLLAGVLLAIILLLAQGGGYVGGAAVAANAARLGRLPGFFAEDRIGIAVIWGVAAVLIPIIREVVVVEAFMRSAL